MLILRRVLGASKWRALILLMIGVTLTVSQPSCGPAVSASEAKNRYLGVLATIAAACGSGFAGVYFEMVLKNAENVSVWGRNFQLGVYSIALASVTMVFDDEVLQRGAFHGWSPMAVLVALVMASGGILVALVVKYTDALIKGYASALSIVVSGVLSNLIFGTELTLQFAAGASVVVISLMNYQSA